MYPKDEDAMNEPLRFALNRDLLREKFDSPEHCALWLFPYRTIVFKGLINRKLSLCWWTCFIEGLYKIPFYAALMKIEDIEADSQFMTVRHRLFLPFITFMIRSHCSMFFFIIKRSGSYWRSSFQCECCKLQVSQRNNAEYIKTWVCQTNCSKFYESLSSQRKVFGYSLEILKEPIDS